MTQMTQATPEAPVAVPPSVRPRTFTPAEQALFRAEDSQAAMGIVGILMTILVLGLIGYIIVAVWVAGG